MTTLVATVSNDFVRRLPGAHTPRGTNAKNRTRDRQLGVVWIKRNRWIEALLLTSSESLGMFVTVESKQLWNKREFHPQVYMSGLLTQQWPSTHIILLERTRRSSWLDAVTTPNASEFLCIQTSLFLREVSNKTNRQKTPETLSPTRY